MPKPVQTRKSNASGVAAGRFPAVLGWAGAYALLYLYFYSFIDYGLNLWDEGALAHGTLRTWNGEMAMRDFNPVGYLPGRYLYAAWFFDLFGVNLHSLRLSVVLFTPAMVLMVYAISRRLMPSAFAVAAAAMTLSSPGMYYNRFYPFFVILIMFTTVRWLERPGQGRTLALLGSILLCVPFKMEVSIFSSVILLVLWMMRRATQEKPADSPPGAMQGVGWLAAGAGVVVLGIFFWRYDVPAKFIEIVFATRESWGNPFPDLLPFGELWRAGGPHQLFERMLFYIPLAVYGIVLVMVGRRWIASRTRTVQQWMLVAVAGFGLCAYGLVVWRAGFDNLIRTLAPFHVLSVYLLYRLFLGKGGAETFRFSWKPEKVLVYFLVLAPVWVYLYEMNVTHGFYVGSVGAVRDNSTRLEIARMQVWTNPYEAEWVNNIVQKIEAVTRPEDAVLALPLNPIFNFLTDRENPLVYDWILPGMLDEEDQREAVRQLKVRLPKLVVFSDIPIDGREERRFSVYAPVIHRFLQSHYQLWETVGLFHVMIPKGRGFVPPGDRI